ncbi:MAG: NUDIX hydrolase [Candidatus Jordarchaeaceae archaeon]
MVIVISTVIIKDDRGRMLLVEDKELWAIPGGKVERGERVIEAAEREVREETGFKINITGLARVYELKREEDYYLFFVFRAKIVSKVGEGVLRFKWFDLDEIKSLKAYPETYLLLKELEEKNSKPAGHQFDIHFYI